MKLWVPKSSLISLPVLILLLYCSEYWALFNKEVTITTYIYKITSSYTKVIQDEKSKFSKNPLIKIVSTTIKTLWKHIP